MGQDAPSRILVLCDPRRRRIVAAEVVPEDRLESRGGEILLDALAGNLQCTAPPPRPWRIVTDRRPFYEHAREALGSLGIRLYYERRLPSLRGLMEDVRDEVALTHIRQNEDRRRRGLPE